jgi:hypothetical protein
MNQAEHVLEQGRALIRAVEALETIVPTGPVLRVQAWFLPEAYRRPLRGIIELAPERAAEEILTASDHP